jgi:hypothetical protein
LLPENALTNVRAIELRSRKNSISNGLTPGIGKNVPILININIPKLNKIRLSKIFFLTGFSTVRRISYI